MGQNHEEDEVTQSLPEEEIVKEEASEIEGLRGKLKEAEDKHLRACADLENFKKRMTKEREEIAIMTSEKLLKELLEVKDHLELALEHSHDATEVKSLREGVHLTLKQLVRFLEKSGVTEVKSLGEPFNPAYHEAIHQETSVEYQPGTVVHVYQKGYSFHGRLLRAARVTVSTESKGGSAA